MKPVSKKSNFYSVLVMRDDDDVKRFRMSAFWLKLLLYFFLLLLLVAAGASYGLHYYYNRYQAAAGERNRLTQEIAGYKIQAERLVNLEEWLRQTDPSRLSAVSETVGEVAAPASAPAAPAEDPVPEPAPLPQPGLKLIEPKITLTGNNRIRLQLELTNTDSNGGLTGKINLQVATADGIFPVTNVAQGDLRFQISRMKRVRTVFGLPEGVSGPSVTEVRVEVLCDGYAPYQENFPVEAQGE